SRHNENQFDSMIGYLDITDTIYSSLVSLNNTDEHYEGENRELNMNFNVELSSFVDFILEQDESQKENVNFKISQQIIFFISEGDGYSWTKELLEESHNKTKGHLWLERIHSNFKPLEKMNDDIMKLKSCRTMSQTWKDFNNNTQYWE
ncbi:5064_t:CDS:2, partial [Cetraspora pellucida]